MSSFNEEQCLWCDPFASDFGMPSDRTILDRIATARKAGQCSICLQKINPGDRIRRMKTVIDGDLFNYRFCTKCCNAMSREQDDDGASFERRIEIGMRKRDKKGDL